MEEFRVIVGAELKSGELDKIKNQINTIQTNPIQVTLNINNIQSQLNPIKQQLSALGKTNINFNSLVSQFQSAGATASSTFVNNFNSGINGVFTNNAQNTIRHMQDTLRSAKFDNSSINTITQNLEHMELAINKITTRIRGNNLRLNITGTDELGRAVTVLKEFDYATGNIRNVGKNISQSFNGAIEQTQEVKTAYQDLLSIQKQLNSNRVKISGLDSTKDSAQITELSGQIERLMADYNNLYATFNRSFTTNQLDNLNRGFDVANTKISTLNAKMADTSAINQQKIAYQDLYNMASQIDRLELKMRGLKSVGGNSNQISELSSQLDKLKVSYQELYSISQGQLSTNQLSSLSSSLYEMQDKLSMLDAKIADTKAKLASQIQLKLDTNKFNSDISTVETNFSRLKIQSEETAIGIQTLKIALNDMKTASSSGDINSLISSYESYKVTLQDINNQISINTNAEKQLAAAEREAANSAKLDASKRELSLNMDKWLKNNSAAATQFGGRLRELQTELQSCDATRLDGIRSDFRMLQTEASLAGKNILSFGDRMKAQMSKLSIYFNSMMVIMQGIRAVKDMYKNVLEIDTAMTQLYRVTDLSSGAYTNLYDTMTNGAKKYGASLSEIIDSTASWVRLGFDANESERLAEITSMYQHVTDLDNDTAVKNLVTAYKGFQEQLMEANNGDATAAIEQITDIYDKLGNEFSESAADVGEGLSKSASVLQQGGASIQEAAGMFTGIQEVLQDSSTAGTTLKILTLRIRGKLLCLRTRKVCTLCYA